MEGAEEGEGEGHHQRGWTTVIAKKICRCRGSFTIREKINRENFNPGIPSVGEWDHTVLVKSGRGLGADATTKILSAKILTRKNF